MINTMADLKVGQSGIVENITAEIALKRRFIDMGVVKGTKISCVLRSPGGDPMAYVIRGAVLAIRNEDARKILIKSESEGM